MSPMFHCTQKTDEKWIKFIFAVCMSACCFQYGTTAFLWRETHHQSLDCLLWIDLISQNILVPRLKIQFTTISIQMLNDFVWFVLFGFYIVHDNDTLYYNIFISTELKTLFVHPFNAGCACERKRLSQKIYRWFIFFISPNRLFHSPFPKLCFSDRLTDWSSVQKRWGLIDKFIMNGWHSRYIRFSG